MTRVALEAAWPALVEARAHLCALHDVDHPMNQAMRAEVFAEAGKLGRKPMDYAAARKHGSSAQRLRA